MRGTRARLLLASVLSLAIVLLVPSAALGTVTITEKTLSTIPERSASTPILSGPNVAFGGIVRFDPTVINRAIDVWSIAADQPVWSYGASEVELADFEGDWVAYRSGVMNEQAHARNVAADITWPIAAGMEGMFVGSIDIKGDTVYWLYGEGPSKFLRRMDLASGEATEVAPLTRALGMTISGSTVFYTRTFTADWDIWAYDMASQETTIISSGAGMQRVVDSNDEYLLYADGDALYLRPIAGGDSKLISSEFNGPAAIGDRFVAWAEYNENLDADVYLYDLDTGLEIPLAQTTYQEREPDTAGGQVAYLKVGTGTETAARVVVADVEVTGPSVQRLKAPNNLKPDRTGKFEVQVVNPDAADVNTITWDWGDGTTTEMTLTGQGTVPATHAYSSAGRFAGTVTVTDSLGLVSEGRFSVRVK